MPCLPLHVTQHIHTSRDHVVDHHAGDIVAFLCTVYEQMRCDDDGDEYANNNNDEVNAVVGVK